jgi:hypothetical protein
VQTLREQLDASILPERVIAIVSALFGVLAAVLVAIGLYGLPSYMVDGASTRSASAWRLARDASRHRPDGGAGALPLVFGGFAVRVPIALVAKVYAGEVLTLVATTEAQAAQANDATGNRCVADRGRRGRDDFRRSLLRRGDYVSGHFIRAGRWNDT